MRNKTIPCVKGDFTGSFLSLGHCRAVMEQGGDGLGDTDGTQLWCGQVNVIYLRLPKGSGQQAAPPHSVQELFCFLAFSPHSVQVLFCFLAFSHVPFSRASLFENLCVCAQRFSHIPPELCPLNFSLFYRVQVGIWAFKGNLDFLNFTSWIHLQPRNCKGQNQWGITHPIYYFIHQDKNQGPQQQGKLLSVILAPHTCLILWSSWSPITKSVVYFISQELLTPGWAFVLWAL